MHLWASLFFVIFIYISYIICLNYLFKFHQMKKYILTYFLTLIAICIYSQKPFSKDMVPQPIYEKESKMVDLYYTAWKMAYDHIKYQDSIVQSPYIDEAFWDNTIWIWDTEFMTLFCKYAPDVFPGIESLNNFYQPILDTAKTSLRIQHPDNPPFFAWIEYEYFKMTNDTAHINHLINETKYLQRHWDWFHNLEYGTTLHFDHALIEAEWTGIGYLWNGIQSGMDNTPRGRGNRKDLLWIDAISQQALAAKYICELCKVAGNKEDEIKFKKRYCDLNDIINRCYWDKEDGFYYDIRKNSGDFVKVITPASYWVLLAEVANKKQAHSMKKMVKNCQKLGGLVPWTTVARDDEEFNSITGNYWKGSVWLPTAYMGIKSLEKYGFFDLANDNAYQIVSHMLKTYEAVTPHTIWECYNPNMPMPAQHGSSRVRADFCGWSALGPISLFIENILGFHSIDAQNNVVHWNLHTKEKHGIKSLKFGNIETDIIYENGEINVTSDKAYTLIVNDGICNVTPGLNIFEYEF